MTTARAETVIAAPIDAVWALMLDTDAYPTWNPFIVEVGRPDGDDRPLRLGDRVVLHVRWHDGGSARATERITALDPPAAGAALLEYEYGGPLAALGLVRGRRQQTLTALDDGTTRYVTHEHLRGAAVRFAPIAKVEDGFERHAAALKAAAEPRAASG
ncbi:MAG: SRPBCC domain-containing protein [Actinomycetota bacterium]|nr:SRPBCC domain-containing protein [Acidimicrobiia bacterium]MDQ3293148.1 SRPBCC domain-containing protein [Actinomycetota bacterium]